MINNEEFEKNTVAALLKSLNYSMARLDYYDPDYEDIEGRKQASALIKELREVIKGEYE